MNRKSAFTILFIAGIAISGCGSDDSDDIEKARQLGEKAFQSMMDDTYCDALREADYAKYLEDC
jgi:hypothetical protein